jgi:hypothetical protein
MIKLQEKNKQEILLEIGLLALISIIFFLVNYLTASLSPSIWQDEVMFADPAINLVLGKGFTSTAWPIQSKEELFAGNSPLYSLLLYPWISLFGISPESVRSINYVLMILIAICFWRIVQNLNLIRSLPLKIFFFISLLVGYSTTFNYRTGRYDCLGIFLLSSFILLVTEYKKSLWRDISLTAIAALFPCAGLQVCVYAILTGIFINIFTNRKYFQELGLVIGGIFIGVGLIYLFYTINNVWPDFVASVVFFSDNKKISLLEKIKLALSRLPSSLSIKQDPSLIFLFIGLIAVTIYQSLKKQFQLRSANLFAITFIFWTITAFLVVAKYPIYYSWMVFIPVCICTFSLLENLSKNYQEQWLSRFILILVLIAGLFGLPLRLVSIMTSLNVRDYQPVIAWVKSHIAKQDIVYCDYQAYYPTKLTASETYLPLYLNAISQQEANNITALIIEPENFNKITTKIGGSWKAGDKITPPEFPASLFGINRLGIGSLYSLQIFRRN